MALRTTRRLLVGFGSGLALTSMSLAAAPPSLADGEAAATARLQAVAARALATALPAASVEADARRQRRNDPGITFTDRVIVKYRSGTSHAEAAAVRREERVAFTRRLPLIGAEVVRVPSGSDVEAVAERLADDPQVAYASPDVVRHPATNDPYWSKQWGLSNSGQISYDAFGDAQSGVAGVDVDALDAWKLTKGSRSAVVGVIDTGVDIGHPDLAGAVWTNSGEIPGNGLDDEGDGYIDDVHGWDFVNDDASVYDWQDLDDHGTHVAGTIAAAADNATGVAGAAPGVTVMPLKFIGPEGGADSDAIEAIGYAKAHGVKILNASWGSRGFSQLSDSDIHLRDAIAASGAVFVAAAGNEGANVDSTPFYPAGFDASNIVSVAAVDNRGRLAPFSNYGRTTVDVAAPGVSILSTLPRRGADVAGVEVTSAAGANRAAWWGFGLEDVTPASSRQELLAGALTHLGTGSARIRLVLDDASRSRVATAAVWKQALVDAGHPLTSVDVVTVPRDAEAPASAFPSDGSTLVWVTGDDMGEDYGDFGPLQSYDRTRLSNFVRGGGKLLLSGADALYLSEGTTFVKNDLRLRFISDGEARTSLVGAAGSRHSGRTFAMAGASPYRDVVQVRDAAAVPSLTYPPDADWATRYGAMDGTSMAAPHVAAAAALALSREPALTGAQLAARLRTRTVPLAGLAGEVATGGLSSAAAVAVGTAGAPTSVKVTAGLGTLTASWSAPASTGGLPIDGYDVTLTPGGYRKVVGARTASAAFAGLPAGRTYTATVRAHNIGGYGSGGKAAAYGASLARTASLASLPYGAAVTHRLTLSQVGTRAALASRTVTLQHRRKGVGAWTTLCTVRTSSKGQAACATRPSVTSEYRWAYAGGGAQLGGYSAVAAVSVVAKVSATSSRTTARRGTSFTISGSVAPKRAGTLVYLQRYASGRWQPMMSAKVSSTGSYRFTVRRSGAEVARFRVATRTDAYQASGASRTLTVRIT